MLRNTLYYISRRAVGRKSGPPNRPLQSIRDVIHSAFGKYLLSTNTISCGVLMVLADVVQQEVEYRQHKLAERYNYARIGRMFIVGTFGLGPLHHYFYIGLNRLYPDKRLVTVTKKVALDQFVMSPICIATFFYGMGLMEGKSVGECTAELKQKCLEVYAMDWCVWPPTQFLNFYVIPVKYQVFYINTVTMVYNIFLSYIKHRTTDKYTLFDS